MNLLLSDYQGNTKMCNPSSGKKSDGAIKDDPSNSYLIPHEHFLTGTYYPME